MDTESPLTRTTRPTGEGDAARDGSSEGRSFWKVWGLVLLAAIGLGVFSVAVTTIGLRLGGRPGLLSLTSTGLIDWILWALLAPGIVWLSRRFPVERGRIVRGVATHMGLGVLVAVIELALFTVLSRGWLLLVGESPELPFFSAVSVIIAYWLPPAMFIYAAITAGVHAFDYYRRSQEREQTVAELRFQLADAQLEALRMQLHPHFLYNTLNTIAALIRDEKTGTAVDMVAGLGDLLRAALDNAGEQLVPLREEVGLARRYLEIEQIRRGDDLVVAYDLDPDTLDGLVPNLLLQPLVENAVRHGVAARPGSHRVEIRSHRNDGRLRLEVEDDGPGVDGDPIRTDRTGVGIRNTLERLERLYGGDFEFTIGNISGGGARVELVIPWRETAREEPTA